MNKEIAQIDFTQANTLDNLMRFSDIMAQGTVAVPAALQGKPADCLAITMQAMQWGLNPFDVARKCHVISGVIGYEAQLVHSVIIASGVIEGRFHYEFFGDWSKVIGNFVERTGKSGKKYQAPNWTAADEKGCGIRVTAKLVDDPEPRTLELLLSQATVRNSTLWASDPQQQLSYLGVKRWQRLFSPEVLMGVYTTDELREQPPERDITPDDKPRSALRLPEKTEDKPGGEMVDDPDWIEVASDIAFRISTATNGELEALGETIKNLSLPDGLVADLRAAYTARRDALKAETQ